MAGTTALGRGLPTTDFLAGVRIGDLERTRPADTELFISYYFIVKGTYFRQVQMVEIVFLEQRLAMLQPEIQFGQEYVDVPQMKFQHHYEQYRKELLMLNYDVVVQTI